MKKTVILLLLLSLTACGGRSIDIVSHRQVTSPVIKKNYAIVREGDNLYAIATANKVSTQELVKLNGIKPPFNLRIGQKIYLPKKKRHRVKKGETLYGLARKYKVSVQELARVNNFSKRTKLYNNVVINIPSNAQDIQRIVPRKTTAVKDLKSSPKKQNTTITQKNKKKTVAVRRVQNLAKIKEKQKARLKKRISSKTPKRAGKFIYPVKGRIISSFGRKSAGISNDGINISAKKGTRVKASENGVVVYAGNGLKNFGNVILIKHDKSFVTVYAHLNTINISRGDIVKQGALIGTVGNTGTVKNSQLHFQIRKRRQILNPKKYLR